MSAVNKAKIFDEARSTSAIRKIIYVGMVDWRRIFGFIAAISAAAFVVLSAAMFGMFKIVEGNGNSEITPLIVGIAQIMLYAVKGFGIVAVIATFLFALQYHFPLVSWRLWSPKTPPEVRKGGLKLARHWQVVARRCFQKVLNPNGDVVCPGLRKMKPAPDSNTGLAILIDMPNEYLPGGISTYLENACLELVKNGRLGIAEVTAGYSDKGTWLILTMKDLTSDIRRWDD